MISFFLQYAANESILIFFVAGSDHSLSNVEQLTMDSFL